MARLGTPELRQQRRQEIINRLEVLLKSVGTPYDKTAVTSLVNDVTGNTGNVDVTVPAGVALVEAESWCQASDVPAPAPNVFMLDNWDNENTDPEVVAGFILRHFDREPVKVLNAQRYGAALASSKILTNLQDVANDCYEDDVKENASFFAEYKNAKNGLDNCLPKKDLNTQQQLLKRFAVANFVFTSDFIDKDVAKDFYDNLNQLNTGNCDSTHSIRKTLVASALLKEGLTVEQSGSVLDHLDNFFGSDDNKIALTPQRLQAYASTMKAIVDKIGINDKGKLNQVNDELLDLLRSNKVEDSSVSTFNDFNSDQKKSIVLKGYLKDACEELDNGSVGAIRDYNDLATKIGKRYKKQIDAFKEKLSTQDGLDPSIKKLVSSNDFLKIDDVAKNLSKGQIESLEKLDSASFRSIVSLLNTVSRKPGSSTDVYGIKPEDLTEYINTLFGQGNEVTSKTISKNFSNAFSKASEDIVTKVLTGNTYDNGAGGEVKVDVVNTYIDNVCSGCRLDADAKKDLRVFLQNMAHHDPSILSDRVSDDTLVLFKEFDGGREIRKFLENYKQAVQNGVSQGVIANFYQEFSQIIQDLTGKSNEFAEIYRIKDVSKKNNTLNTFRNNLKSTIRDPLESFNETFSDSIKQQIKENKQADKELDESNAEEEAKEKQKIEDVKTVDDENLKSRLTGTPELEGAYKLHKSCLEDKDGQINDAYAAGLLAFTQSKDTTYDDTAIILGNIYDKIKDEEDKKDILSNIVSSGGLIVYKDILKKDEFDLSLLRKMAINAFDDDEKIIKTLNNTAQENLKGTLCENKDGKVCLDKRDTTKEIGKEYEFTKTEWISYMAENGSKIKSKDYEFADMNEEQKKAFKKACLYLSPKLLEQEAVCAAISQNIDKIKDDPEFFIHAINETYSKQNREKKEPTLETVNDIVVKASDQRKTILEKMTKEDFLELKGDAVWNVIKDNSYTTKMIDYAPAGATEEEKECRRLYNSSIVANSNDPTIFTDNGKKPAAAAAGQIGYDTLNLNTYLSNCENASQKKTATKEITSATNNFETDFFTKPGGGFYNKKEYMQTIFDDVSKNNHLNITLKSRKVAPKYQQEVEDEFVWSTVTNDKLNSDTEIGLIQKISRLNETDRKNAIRYLKNITDVYKDTKDTKSRDKFLSNVVRELLRVKRRPTTLDFKKAALKSMLTMKGVSKADQELLFENEERASFFLENYKMFLSIDKEEFTQIFKKSQDPVENGKAIDTIVEVAKDFKAPLGREFIIRSATYLSADSVINHFGKCIKIQLNNDSFFRKRKFSDIYNDKVGQYEGELALEKARYMNLVYVADHSYPPLGSFGSIYSDIKDDVKDVHLLTQMKLINKDLALLVNTTQTGKKNDKMLNTRKDICRFIETRKKSYALKPLDNFSDDDLIESINRFVYDGKDKNSAEEFAKALMKYVKTKRDAATSAVPYNKNNVETNLQTEFLDTNQQYKAISNALNSAGVDTLERQKLKEQLTELTDLAKLYVKYDDNPEKLLHTLGNGMNLAMHNSVYDSGTDKMYDNVDKRQKTILFAAGGSSTYALTNIYNIGNDVMSASLSGLNDTNYFTNAGKSYADIATAIDSKHAEAKQKEVQHKSVSGNAVITHDELYKIEGLETFLTYTYNKARAMALTAGMTEQEADFRAMAMTQAMDRKILNDDVFREQLKKQIKEEEKQKINLLMLDYVDGKVEDIYSNVDSTAKEINNKIDNTIKNISTSDGTLYDIKLEEGEAKDIFNDTVKELKDSVTSHLKIMGKNVSFINKTTFKKFISNKKKEAEKSLSDTRSQLEKLCMDQLDAIEKNSDFSYQKYDQKEKAQAIITATSNDYKFNDECMIMASNHASKLDNFSGEDLQNFGIACNYIINKDNFKKAFEQIKSPQTLAKVSKLIADEAKEGWDLASDKEFKANFILLLATDSKTDALDTFTTTSPINDNDVLSSLCSKGFKELNKKQKTLILKKIDENKLNTFVEELVEQDNIEQLEIYDILKTDDDLKKHTQNALTKIINLDNKNVKIYDTINNSSSQDGVIEQIVTEINYNPNLGATSNDEILYEKAGNKIGELSPKGTDFGKEFANFINKYGDGEEEDLSQEYIEHAKQKLAYAFVFANDYKEGLKLAKSYEDLLDNLEPDNKQYVFNALLEKECGNPHKSYDVTAEDFVNKILEVDEILTKQEDKDLFVQTVKNYVSMIENDSQKVADIFTNLCNSDSKNAPLYVAALLNDQIELSKSRPITIKTGAFSKDDNYGVERHMPDTTEIIDNAIKKISVGTDTPDNITKTAKNFYTLIKSIPDAENKEQVMNGVMSYIESLDKTEEQAKLSVSLAKMFTKKMDAEKDRELSEKLLTNMARNFAGNEDLFIEIMNRLDTNKPQEEILQAELFYKYSKYADSTSTQYIYDNSSVKNNEKLEKKYYRTSDGSYSKKNNRDVSDILSDIGVREEEDQKIIINQLKRCADADAVAKILNGFIEEHNKLAETNGRDKIDTLNEQDKKKISKQIMIKRKDLLKGLISGDEKIFEGGSVMLDTVEKYAKSMSNDEYNKDSTTKGELLGAVSKMKKREETFRKKAQTITNCKEFNYKRALTAADFLSKMKCANKIIAEFETKNKNGYYVSELEKMKYEAAKIKKRELLEQKYDFTQSNRHWWNGKTLGRRMWNSICKGGDYTGQYILGHLAGSAIKFAMITLPLVTGGVISYFAFAGAALISGGLGVAAVIGASILSIALCAAAGYAAYRIHNSNLCRHVNHWPDYWRDKALKIKEEKLMEKAEATLKKSNHALAVLDGKQIKELNIQDLSDRKTTEQVNVNYVDEKNMTLRSKRLRGIRGTRFIRINDFTGKDDIEHTFRKGTIRRTNDMNASEAFADMKLKKYDKDMKKIVKAFASAKTVGLYDKSEVQKIDPDKKKDEKSQSR